MLQLQVSKQRLALILRLDDLHDVLHRPRDYGVQRRGNDGPVQQHAAVESRLKLASGVFLNIREYCDEKGE